MSHEPSCEDTWTQTPAAEQQLSEKESSGGHRGVGAWHRETRVMSWLGDLADRRGWMSRQVILETRRTGLGDCWQETDCLIGWTISR